MKPILVVMPDSATSWYSADAGGPGNVATSIGRDLPAAIEATFLVGADRDHRAVSGISVGGNGALRLGLGLRIAALGLAMVAGGPAQAIVGPSVDGTALAPYVVMVLNRSGDVAGYCSGLVVAPMVVLTAAHCVPDGAALKVHFRDAGNAPVLLDVAAVMRHPGYRRDAIRTREQSIDLALVRLTAPLPLRFQAAAYGGGFGQPGTRYRIAGFGLTREGDPTSSGKLRVGTVEARDPMSSVLLWARDPAGRSTGACTGDSGGPVFGESKTVAVALMVWSAGDGVRRCGALTQAVWLGPEKTWIDGIVSRWSGPGG